MILVIDNYDSFTYNLVQRLGEIDGELDIQVFRNDQISAEEILECRGKLPILGVCLGHQSIGQATGATIVRAKHLMHGKTDEIHHDGEGMFRGLPNPFTATRYHSLVIEPGTLSPEFDVTAWAFAPDGSKEIMGIRHKSEPIEGLQFHPESFLTTSGHDLLRNFLSMSLQPTQDAQ
jgi:anthranilate synthase component 2